MKFYLIYLYMFFIFTESFSQIDDSTLTFLLGEVASIITNGTVEHFFGCKSQDDFTADDIEYILINRNNRDTPIKLNSDTFFKIDINKDTKILCSGWQGKASSMTDMANAYLDRYDCNIIVVDASKVTTTHYSQAYCNNIKAGDFVSDFLCTLHDNEFLNFDRVHMVGLSLGGQLTGIVGHEVQHKCKQKVNRITGLDPAGPIFQNQDKSKRLDKGDAKFVDVIHTNMGFFGYYGSMGHVDFFLNCGTVQPGCIIKSKFPNIIEIMVMLLGCSHGRSLLIFTESIQGPVFNSTSCSSCPNSNGIGLCKGADIVNARHAVMGEDCPHNPPARKFVVKTNGKSPYYISEN